MISVLYMDIFITNADVSAGWSSLVARRAHNPKVVGSNPAPATSFRWIMIDVVYFFTT